MAKAMIKEANDPSPDAKEETTLPIVQGTAAVASSGAIATRPANTSIAINRPAEVEVYEDIEEGEDTGLDDVTEKERRIPILRVLDPKSPQCLDPSDGGIPGARGGSIFNTSTNQVYDGKVGLYMIPIYRYCRYVDYIRRDKNGSGGGFAGILEPDDPIVKRRQAEALKEFGDLFRKLPNGQTEDGKDKELVETYYVPSLMVVPLPDGSFPGEFGTVFPALIPFSSTNIKVYQGFVERNKTFRYPARRKGTGEIYNAQPTLWTHVWRLRSKITKRGDQSWYVWAMSLAATDASGAELEYKHSRLPRDSALYREAEQLREMILEGNAEIDYSKQSADLASGDGGGGDAGSVHDQIPFGNG